MIARLDCLTNNTLACFYKDQGNHMAALEYLCKFSLLDATLNIETEN